MPISGKRRFLAPTFWVSHTACFVVPVLLFVLRPLGMTWNQSFILATLVLVITWWCTGLVSKIPSSCALLGVFVFASPAPLPTVFSFPLSETFLLIVFSYLFSRGIENSGLPERVLEPRLTRWVNTPMRALVSLIIVLTATIYIIPQPLARLIVLATIYRNYLAKTDAPERTKSLILFSVFVFYLIINMSLLDADIILNPAAAAFAGVSISNVEWMFFMGPPTLIFGAGALGLLYLIFRKDIRKIRFGLLTSETTANRTFTSKDRLTVLVISCTVLLWMADGLLGQTLPFRINPALVACISTLILFAMKVLHPRDMKVIDVSTIIFLSAAFSIGGVLTASGLSDIIFLRMATLFPSSYSLTFVIAVVLVSMGIHLILGSTTTTLSVIIPGFLVINSGILSPEATLFLCYTSVASHYIVPFHTVSMMLGFAGGFFPAWYVLKYGLVLKIFLFVSILSIYLPWWRFTGLI